MRLRTLLRTRTTRTATNDGDGALLRNSGDEYGSRILLRMLTTELTTNQRLTNTAAGWLPNKRMKLTNLSAAPGTHTDRSAASCPCGETDGGTGSQLILGVGRT